jgi:hypothetical protein
MQINISKSQTTAILDKYFYVLWLFLPFLYFIIGNFTQISLIETLVVLIVPVILSLLLFSLRLIFSFITGVENITLLSLIYCLLIFFTFNYAVFGISKILYLITCIITIVIIPYLITRSDKLKEIFKITTLTIFVICVIQILIALINSQSLSPSKNNNVSSVEFTLGESIKRKYLPNVYLIVLDGYARSDELSYLGFDNSKYESMLLDNGFLIANSARSNFMGSYLSMYTLWNMDLPEDFNNYREIESGLLYDSVALRNFRKLGYTYIKMGPNQSTAQDCSGFEDICLFKINEIDGTAGGLSGNILSQIFRMTPIYGVLERYFGFGRQTYLKSTIADAEKSLKYDDFDPIKRYLISINVWQPHAPYILKKNCALRDSAIPYEGSWDIKKVQGYIDSTACVNLQIESIIDHISLNDPSSIIIIQSDHGHSFFAKTDTDGELLSQKQINARLNIFWAAKMPQECNKNFYNSITSVNTMRLVLSCITNNNPNFSKDKSYVHNLNDVNTDFIEILK